MKWEHLNELETIAYETKAMLEVVIDGLSNEDCRPNLDYSSTVIRLATEKVDRLNGIVEEIFKERREKQELSKTAFSLTEKQENDDGTTSFEISGSKEDMERLFSAFFTSALIRGIEAEESINERWINKLKIIEAAKEFCEAMERWEEEDDLDYEPECRELREALSEAIAK